jgi:hypothetical protein
MACSFPALCQWRKQSFRLKLRSLLMDIRDQQSCVLDCPVRVRGFPAIVLGQQPYAAVAQAVDPPFEPGPFATEHVLILLESRFRPGDRPQTGSSPPQSFNEILTLAEVKSYLRLPDRSPADQAEDDELTSPIVAAREQAEIMQGRDTS